MKSIPKSKRLQVATSVVVLAAVGAVSGCGGGTLISPAEVETQLRSKLQDRVSIFENETLRDAEITGVSCEDAVGRGENALVCHVKYRVIDGTVGQDEFLQVTRGNDGSWSSKAIR